MGYYTRFELEVINDDFKTDHKAEISKIADYGDCFDDEHKWYDYQDHMCEYSQRFPTFIFKLIGEGEETGDLWITYFKDGKMQSCDAKITYDEYDESKLV